MHHRAPYLGFIIELMAGTYISYCLDYFLLRCCCCGQKSSRQREVTAGCEHGRRVGPRSCLLNSSLLSLSGRVSFPRDPELPCCATGEEHPPTKKKLRGKLCTSLESASCQPYSVQLGTRNKFIYSLLAFISFILWFYIIIGLICRNIANYCLI